MGEPQRPVVLAAEKSLIAPALRTEFEARAELALAGPDTWRRQLERADAILASPYLALDAGALAAASRLAVITHVGTAVHCDVPAASALGIPVLHNRGENADSVAEHTIGLLLAITKRIPQSDAEVRRRETWDVAAANLATVELRGRTLGIVGFGAVGRRVADIAAHGLGLRVIAAHNRPGVVTAAGYDELPLDELLPQIDVLSLHLPSNPSTRHLIDGRRLNRLKTGSWVINTARADVMDYSALVDLLRSGHLAGAGIDTWPGHQADAHSPMIDLPNIVLTQHNAGFTHESIARMVQATVAGLFETLAGARPRSSTLVNPEIWPVRRLSRRSMIIVDI